jgi:hypothetical protein
LRVFKYFSLLDIISKLRGLGASIQAILASLAAIFTVQFFVLFGATVQKLAINSEKK